MQSLFEADSMTLFGRLNEIKEKLLDLHISAYRVSILQDEKELIEKEISNRGFTIE